MWKGERDKLGIIRSVTPLQLSRLIANAAADKKARGIVRLDIRQKSSIADYFVICEGDTDRQVRAITDAILEACQAQGVRPLRTAGYEEGSWVVLDYASVIVHVFLPGERSYYDLESLWKTPAKAGRAAATNGTKKASTKERARPKVKPTRPSRRKVRTA
jgi:ribosome-associated protein